MALPAMNYPDDAEIRRSVGLAVRVVMTAKGFTGKALAGRVAGLTEGTLSERLTGKTGFKAVELYRIGAVLNVPVGTFFEDPEDLVTRSRWYAEDGTPVLPMLVTGGLLDEPVQPELPLYRPELASVQ